MRRILFLVACFGTFLTSSVVRAQSANPLSAPLTPSRFGAEAGVNINQQSGSFKSDCGCDFPSGSGVSYFVSGVAEMHVTQKVALMGRVTFSLVNTTSNSTVDTIQYISDKSGPKLDSAITKMYEKAVTHLTYFMITPMVRYDLWKALFVAAGPSLGFAVASNIHVEESTSPGYVFWDDLSTTRVTQDGPVPSLSALRLGVSAMIGYEIEITPKLVFIPTAALDLPLTSVTSGSTWKIASYQIGGAIRWKMHL